MSCAAMNEVRELERSARLIGQLARAFPQLDVDHARAVLEGVEREVQRWLAERRTASELLREVIRQLEESRLDQPAPRRRVARPDRGHAGVQRRAAEDPPGDRSSWSRTARTVSGYTFGGYDHKNSPRAASLANQPWRVGVFRRFCWRQLCDRGGAQILQHFRCAALFEPSQWVSGDLVGGASNQRVSARRLAVFGPLGEKLERRDLRFLETVAGSCWLPSMLEHVGSFRLPTCRAAKVCRPMGYVGNMFQHTHGYRHQVPLAGARRTAAGRAGPQ